MSLQALAFCADNEAAIKEFGIERSEPINSGFFFWNYKYVESPYIVERRALDVFINGHCVRKGPEWPLPKKAAHADPGDPPPGSSPLNFVDGHGEPYWWKKWHYLRDTYDYATAKNMMFDLYKKCPALTKIEWHPTRSDAIRLESATDKLSVALTLETPDPPPPKALENALIACRRYRDRLNQNCLLSIHESGFEHLACGQSALEVLDVLASEASIEEKNDKLVQIGFLKKIEAVERPYARLFQHSEQLSERLNTGVKKKQVEQPLP